MNDSYLACLLGGAIGDALGAPVEFMKWRDIQERFGDGGITRYAVAYGRTGAITDDTQMALFTAEGLLRAQHGQFFANDGDYAASLHQACLRWLKTQGVASRHPLFGAVQDGWLLEQQELWSDRAAGTTCKTALAGAEAGSLTRHINDSKGCGAVMRVAPVGAFCHAVASKMAAAIDIEKAFNLGCLAGAITHGNPTGYLAAGSYAAIVARLLSGTTIRRAIEDVLPVLRHRDGWYDCHRKLEYVLRVTEVAGQYPHRETVQALGEGWTGEEALAVGLYCAIVAEGDFDYALRLAVNHDGDSDSTGSIAGAICGAAHGSAVIDQHWLEELELVDAVQQMAADLEAVHSGSLAWQERYPRFVATL